MPVRSQRHVTAAGRGSVSLTPPDYIAGVISAAVPVAAAKRLGAVQFDVTCDANVDWVTAYRVPAGGTLDRNQHSAARFKVIPGQVNRITDGDISRTNRLVGVGTLRRQWTFATGVYTHANTSLNNKVQISADGTNWFAQTAPDTDCQWGAIDYSPTLNRICAISSSGTSRCMTSDDGGLTWTQRSIPAASWVSVVWSPELNLFVVGTNSSSAGMCTSPDGITWTQRTKPATFITRGLCWVKELGLFVSCCSGGVAGQRVLTSPDGITWTPQNTPLPDVTWQAICWAKELGLLVAVASAGVTTNQRVMTSPDGVNWTLRNAPDGAWYDIAWSPSLGRLVSVADSGLYRAMYSANGIDWFVTQVPVYQQYRTVCWSPALNLFVAASVQGSGTRYMTSPDGINWTGRTNAPGGGSANDIVWVGAPHNRFVEVSNNSIVSPESVTWGGLAIPDGATVRYEVDPTSTGALSPVVSEPNRAVGIAHTAIGLARGKLVAWFPADVFGFCANTDIATAFNQNPIAYVETGTCAPQGTWDYYIYPSTNIGVEGAPITVAGIVII